MLRNVAVAFLLITLAPGMGLAEKMQDRSLSALR